MFKKLYKKWLNFLIEIFNFFYLPYLRAFCKKKLKKLPQGTQLFFLTRMDFGTFLYLTYYARCWEEVRGPTCFVILCSKWKEAKELARLICNKSYIINTESF